jgi:hypothetical protein
MKRTGVTEVGKLEEDEDKLDALIEQVESQGKAQHEATKHAYVSHEDLMMARQRRDQTVLVIKPTADTLMETLDQTQAQNQAQLKLQLYIRSMAEVGVHICVGQEDDPGEGGSQQVDSKEVVNTVNVEHGDVDVTAKTVENANKTKMREDDLQDVLEIIRDDQIEENNASEVISGVSKESNKEEDETTAEFRVFRIKVKKNIPK